MSIRVLLFATLADVAGTGEAVVQAEECADVRAVFDRLARTFPALEKRRHSVLSARNAEFAPLDTPVQDGDEIAFFPPVSGG